MNMKKYGLLIAIGGMMISFQAVGEKPGRVTQQDGKVAMSCYDPNEAGAGEWQAGLHHYDARWEWYMTLPLGAA